MGPGPEGQGQASAPESRDSPKWARGHVLSTALCTADPSGPTLRWLAFLLRGCPWKEVPEQESHQGLCVGSSRRGSAAVQKRQLQLQFAGTGPQGSMPNPRRVSLSTEVPFFCSHTGETEWAEEMGYLGKSPRSLT